MHFYPTVHVTLHHQRVVSEEDHRGLWQHLDRLETELPIEPLQTADLLEFTQRENKTERSGDSVCETESRESVGDRDAVPTGAIMCPCV